MATGECNCGAVKFEISCEISEVYICHCSICQRYTGSNGVAVVLVDNDEFNWIIGEDKISTWRKPGHDWQAWFCPKCGLPLPGTNDDTRVFVPAGLILEGGEDLKIAHHIWINSKAVWDEIEGSARQHKEAFEE